MKQVQLGQSSLLISRIGLGCMGMSQSYGPTNEAESIATIHHALEYGFLLPLQGDIFSSRWLPTTISLRKSWALHPDGQISITQAARYRKPTATFRNVLAVVRRSLWGMETFSTSRTDPHVVLVPHSTLERWSVAVCSCVVNVQSRASILCVKSFIAPILA